jgi:hypothetical protein
MSDRRNARKKILVVSHERSGTHFLINTIAQCFNYDPQQIDLINRQGVVQWDDPASVKRWFQQYQGSFVPNVFKSHHAYPLLADFLSDLADEFTVFYIRRDGRDVMTSFWVYLNKIGPGWGPKTATVGEFMRATSVGRSIQFQATRRRITMLKRWIEHVEGWTANRLSLPIHYISYEALNGQHNKVVDMLAEVLDEPPISRDRPDLRSPLAVLPWRGQVGTWREFFTEEDISYFDHHVRQIGATDKTLRGLLSSLFRS